LLVVGGSILVQIDGAASIIVGKLSRIVDGISEGNLTLLAGFSLFLLLGLDGEGEDAISAIWVSAIWVSAIVESASGERKGQGRIRICEGSRRNDGLVGGSILVQVNRVPQQISGELISRNDRNLALLATKRSCSVRSGIMVRIAGIGSGKRSDAISQRCDDFLGDFLLLEEGGGSRGLLSSIGLENDALDGVFNGGGCAVDDGMGSVGERDLASGARLGLIHCLEVSLLGLNNLSGIFNGERSDASVNWGLQVGSGTNREIVGDNFEAIATSGVRDLDNFALGVNVGVRADLVSKSIAEVGGGLAGVSITVRSLTESILSVVLGSVIARVETVGVARVGDLGSGTSQEESKDKGLHDCNLN